MYIRFVVGADGEDHRQLTGVVTEARFLREAGCLLPAEIATLEDAYGWLDNHLPVPPFEAGSWPRDAVCWFDGRAREPVRHVWDVVALLRDHDVPVRMLRSRDPGRVHYRDRYQVVVSEWRRPVEGRPV